LNFFLVGYERDGIVKLTWACLLKTVYETNFAYKKYERTKKQLSNMVAV